MFTLLIFSVIAIVLIIVAISCCIVHYLFIKLPEQQRSILDKFVPCVVSQISLEYGVLSHIQQRQIAEEKMSEIFSGMGIPNPGRVMIEAAVSDALHKRWIKEADMWIEELKTDQLSQAETMEMPVTPIKEEMWIL
jgi:hypothetical protein